jgi:hypothetical protein
VSSRSPPQAKSFFTTVPVRGGASGDFWIALSTVVALYVLLNTGHSLSYRHTTQVKCMGVDVIPRVRFVWDEFGFGYRCSLY